MSNFEKMQYYLSVGLTGQEIAERLQIHRITVGRWKKEVREQHLAFEKCLKEEWAKARRESKRIHREDIS